MINHTESRALRSDKVAYLRCIALANEKLRKTGPVFDTLDYVGELE